ncbi:MAG: zinc ribbon domain-containing protein [Ignisphaera sp.]
MGYEAPERDLETRHVNPKKTSPTCPRCRGRLKDSGGRVLRCTKCGFAGDGDVIVCMNLFLRHTRCGVLGATPNSS